MLKTTDLKYIYGPIYSWRLGMSLGIDPVSSSHKICNMDCVYCQLGKTPLYSEERKVFVETKEILEEIKMLPPVHIDHLTFSGRGEPTLAKNLGEMIERLRHLRKEKIAVITNSTLLYHKDVQKDLSLADFVLAKLDACSHETFQAINCTTSGIKFEVLLDGIAQFKKVFKGKLALQIMFIKENKEYAHEIAQIAKKIHPDEIQLCTAVRECCATPLLKKEILNIKHYFTGLPTITFYDSDQKNTEPFNMGKTIKRHGRLRKN